MTQTIVIPLCSLIKIFVILERGFEFKSTKVNDINANVLEEYTSIVITLKREKKN